MLTGQKLHEEGQKIKSEVQVNRARMEIAANHYKSSFSELVKWICGIFDPKLTPVVVALVDGFVLCVDSNDKVYITSMDMLVKDQFEAEDLGENSAVPGFRHTIINVGQELVLIPAHPSTKALFYDAVAHDGLFEQCELLAHVFKSCSDSEITLMKNKINSVKANTGRFPSLFKVDDFISEMRGEPFLSSSED